MSWGILPWGTTPWGGGGTTAGDADIELTEVNIVAADLIELVFSREVKLNDDALSPDSYTVTTTNGSARPVTVREVKADGGQAADNTIYLVVTPPSLAVTYTVTVTGTLKSLDDTALSSNSRDIFTRRTKVDSICSTRPPIYDLRPGAIYRNILNAIGREDDRIGGSQNEFDPDPEDDE